MLVFIQPATVLRWHREGYRRYWRRRSGGPGRPKTPRNYISLIRRISSDNPGWGEERIALEPRGKLGYVLVRMELRSRKVVHVAVTASPTLAWLKQRIRERHGELLQAIEASESRIGEIEALFSEPTFYQDVAPEEIRPLEEERAELRSRLDGLLAEWEQVEENLSALR